MGLRPSAPAKREEAPGSDWTWFVFWFVSGSDWEGGAKGRERGEGGRVRTEGKGGGRGPRGEEGRGKGKKGAHHEDADIELYSPTPNPVSQQSSSQ